MRLSRALNPSTRHRPGRPDGVCPVCGFTPSEGNGRLVDPRSLREVCIRCGAELTKGDNADDDFAT